MSMISYQSSWICIFTCRYCLLWTLIRIIFTGSNLCEFVPILASFFAWINTLNEIYGRYGVHSNLELIFMKLAIKPVRLHSKRDKMVNNKHRHFRIAFRICNRVTRLRSGEIYTEESISFNAFSFASWILDHSKVYRFSHYHARSGCQWPSGWRADI